LEFFDEAAYLEANPDVSKAIENGTLEGGWIHFNLFGFRENRPGLPRATARRVRRLLDEASVISVPPRHLRLRVSGMEDEESFTKLGQVLSLSIEAAIQYGRLELTDGSSILDFGCGCGRVLGWFGKLYPNCKLYGSDIDAEAIAWSRANQPALADFACNSELPPLMYDDESFDLLFSISVFTHLPEQMQHAWLAELARVTKRGGHLLLSIHSKALLVTDSEVVLKQFQDDGFYYSVGDGTDGLPEFYQTTFHSEPYIRERWNEYFEVEAILHRGVANHQDMVLCKRV
jgi:SAM-dependent methyltransferase|tara:strand:+ start:1267 stop:2130 length:864 start_codon:yes stop_codon:yes gene_type:complete